MANETMVLIATQTVGAGGASNIDFTSIPQTFTDLYLVGSLRTNLASDSENCRIDFNNNTANQASILLAGYGTGSANYSYTYINIRNVPSANGTANVFGNMSAYIPNYAENRNKNISIDNVPERNTPDNFFISLIGGSWNDTSAITSVKLSTAGGGSFVQYSSISLYGILKGSGGATVS